MCIRDRSFHHRLAGFVAELPDKVDVNTLGVSERDVERVGVGRSRRRRCGVDLDWGLDDPGWSDLAGGVIDGLQSGKRRPAGISAEATLFGSGPPSGLLRDGRPVDRPVLAPVATVRGLQSRTFGGAVPACLVGCECRIERVTDPDQRCDLGCLFGDRDPLAALEHLRYGFVETERPRDVPHSRWCFGVPAGGGRPGARPGLGVLTGCVVEGPGGWRLGARVADEETLGGWVDHASVLAGDPLTLYVHSTLGAVEVTAYRLGHYDGAGARALDALVSWRGCDSACGSGHFLVAAGGRIGGALAQVATGEDEPSPEAVRRWTREAIIHCIYGVDKNPLAVDLCKVALWIEGFSEGKPLTFLDAHIKCGDSLVGVFDLKVLDDGIPDGAFDAVTGDDKTVARELKRRNKQERGGQLGLVFQAEQDALDQAARQWQAQFDSPEDTPAQVRQKRAAYRKLQQQEDGPRTACDLWTAAFFTPLTAANAAAGMIPTTASLQEYRRQPAAADPRLVAHARALAVRNQFFHWPLEFPHVFAAGGFTVMLGNPPWDMLQLNPQEFFAVRIPQIAAAPNTAVRDQLIAAVANDDPALYAEFQAAKHTVDAYQRLSLIHISEPTRPY